MIDIFQLNTSDIEQLLQPANPGAQITDIQKVHYSPTKLYQKLFEISPASIVNPGNCSVLFGYLTWDYKRLNSFRDWLLTTPWHGGIAVVYKRELQTWIAEPDGMAWSTGTDFVATPHSLLVFMDDLMIPQNNTTNTLGQYIEANYQGYGNWAKSEFTTFSREQNLFSFDGYLIKTNI